MLSAPVILELHDLTKVIEGREITKRCNLSLQAGEVCAIIGPNGAGKTTLLKMIAGLTFPTTGKILIAGQHFTAGTLDGSLRSIGATIEAPEFFAGSTAYQVLQLHFDLLGFTPHESIEALLGRVGLASALQTPVASFSYGMKQRLALARAISHRPDLIILDEPTNGFDPTGIAELRHIISQLARAGVTILIASHMLTELERTTHSVAVLMQGVLGKKRRIEEILEGAHGSLEAFYEASVTGNRL